MITTRVIHWINKMWCPFNLKSWWFMTLRALRAPYTVSACAVCCGNLNNPASLISSSPHQSSSLVELQLMEVCLLLRIHTFLFSLLPFIIIEHKARMVCLVASVCVFVGPTSHALSPTWWHLRWSITLNNFLVDHQFEKLEVHEIGRLPEIDTPEGSRTARQVSPSSLSSVLEPTGVPTTGSLHIPRTSNCVLFVHLCFTFNQRNY